MSLVRLKRSTRGASALAAVVAVLLGIVWSAFPSLFTATARAAGETCNWTATYAISCSGGAFAGPQTLSSQPPAVPNTPSRLTGSILINKPSGGQCLVFIAATFPQRNNVRALLQPYNVGGPVVGASGGPPPCAQEDVSALNGDLVPVTGTRPSLGDSPETDVQKRVTVNVISDQTPDASPGSDTITITQNGKTVGTASPAKTVSTPAPYGDPSAPGASLFTDPTAGYSANFELDPGQYQACGVPIGGCKDFTKVKFQPLTVTLGSAPTTGTIPVILYLHYANGANDPSFNFGTPIVELQQPDGTLITTTTLSQVVHNPVDPGATGNPTELSEVMLTGKFDNVPAGTYKICLKSQQVNVCQNYTKAANPSPPAVFTLNAVQTQQLIDDANIKGPRCAVKGLGEISCPANVGPGTDNCYIRDPTSAKPEDWVKSNCAELIAAAPAAIPADKGCTGTGINCDLTKGYIDPLVKALVALVGVGATLGIILGAIEYSSSSGDSRKVAQAKRRIAISVMTFIGLLLFYAFLNWIIPGGIG